MGGAEDRLALGAGVTRFFAGAFSGTTPFFSSVVAVVVAAATPDELCALTFPRVGFVGTMLRRLAVELDNPSSSLTADLAMLCLRFFSELFVISSVVLDFMDGGIGLLFLGFFMVDVDDDGGTLG